MKFCTQRSSLLVKFVWISIYSKLQLGFIVWNWDRQPNGGESGSVEKKLYLFLEFAFDLYIMRIHTHIRILTRTHAHTFESDILVNYVIVCRCRYERSIDINLHAHTHSLTHRRARTQRKLESQFGRTHTRAVMICHLYHRLLRFFLFSIKNFEIVLYLDWLANVYLPESTLYFHGNACVRACALCKCIYQYFEKPWRHLLKVIAMRMGKYLMNWKFMQLKISIPHSHTHANARIHTPNCTHTHAQNPIRIYRLCGKRWMVRVNVWVNDFWASKNFCANQFWFGVDVFILGLNWHSLKFDVVAAPHRSIQNELNCWESRFLDSLNFVQNNYATRNTNFSHKCDGTIFLMRNMGTNVCRSCNVMSCHVTWSW